MRKYAYQIEDTYSFELSQFSIINLFASTIFSLFLSEGQ